MRPEPSAPEFTELEVAAVTPVYSYRSAPPIIQVTGPSSDKILVGAWDAGFCSCLNYVVPNGCMACCCPWVSLAQISARLELYPFAKTLLVVLTLHIGVWAGIVLSFAQHKRRHPQDDHDDINWFGSIPETPVHGRVSPWLLLSVFCGVVYVVAVWQLRGRVRDRFQISGSRGWDFLAAGCCACCTVAQIATHVKSYTPGSCAFGPSADTLPAYP